MGMLRRRRNERGASAVEFGLVMIPFFVLVFGLIEYGWYFYVAQNTSGAASTVSRKLEVGDCWGTGQALTYTQNQAGTVSGVVMNPPGSGSAPSPGTSFTVTVTSNAKILSFLPVPSNGVITRVVTAQVEDDKATSC
jgi:Flp pilus assembly protein TadG